MKEHDRDDGCGENRQIKRVLLMVTSEDSLILVDGLAKRLCARGLEVHVSASLGSESSNYSDDVTLHHIPMTRTINLRNDVFSLKAVWRLIEEIQPDAVLAGTPKAGLLGMIASRLHGVPTRVYVLHGLRLETEHGIKRGILAGLERLATACAVRIISVSASLKDRAIELNLVNPGKIVVIGCGSATGVDLDQFNENVLPAVISDLHSPVLAFVGRVTRDKGVALLGGALGILSAGGVRGSLLVVGGDDAPESPHLRRILNESGWDVRHLGHVSNVAPYLALADVLCLPSRREGFGTVVIEAGAMGVPTVGSQATGLIDAIVDGETGIIVPERDPAQFADAVRRLTESPKTRLRMGDAAKSRVLAEFTEDKVLSAWCDFLVLLLNQPSTRSSISRVRGNAASREKVRIKQVPSMLALSIHDIIRRRSLRSG